MSIIDDIRHPSRFDSPGITDEIEQLTRDTARQLVADSGFMRDAEAPVRELNRAVARLFVEREELILVALACFIVQVPMLALGSPGTAKSQVLRSIARGLGLADRPILLADFNNQMLQLINPPPAGRGGRTPPPPPRTQRRYFEYLVTRFTTADEILGSPHLELMIRQAMFYRQTDGLLPEAHVAFLDEVFKANSAILNALLSIMNERLFYNAGQPVRVPLTMVFGASNEPPQEEELKALFDRFPVRVLCDSVKDEKLPELLDRAQDGAVAGVFGDGIPIGHIATVNHFRLLHRLTMIREAAWDGRDGFRRDFISMFRLFRREFEISDRSMSRFYMLTFALALLRDKPYPGAEELQVFKYCFQQLDSGPALADAVDRRLNHLGALR